MVGVEDWIEKASDMTDTVPTFGYLERLEVSHSVDPDKWQGLRLEVVLRSGISADSLRTVVVFEGVHQLKIQDPDDCSVYMLQATSIEDRQLELARYEVREVEHGAMSFLCRSFTAHIEDR